MTSLKLLSRTNLCYTISVMQLSAELQTIEPNTRLLVAHNSVQQCQLVSQYDHTDGSGRQPEQIVSNLAAERYDKGDAQGVFDHLAGGGGKLSLL